MSSFYSKYFSCLLPNYKYFFSYTEKISEAEYDILSSFCPAEKKLKGTKEDLSEVSWETFMNSNTQQRQPGLLRPPSPGADDLGFLMESDDSMCPKCHLTTDDFDTETELCEFKKGEY